MNLAQNSPLPTFTRLHARIIQEEGAFTVRIRMVNHLNQDEGAWGKEIASSIEMASGMISALAEQFSIPQECISIKISMNSYRDGTLH
jgi:hypothetical protein